MKTYTLILTSHERETLLLILGNMQPERGIDKASALFDRVHSLVPIVTHSYVPETHSPTHVCSRCGKPGNGGGWASTAKVYCLRCAAELNAINATNTNDLHNRVIDGLEP